MGSGSSAGMVDRAVAELKDICRKIRKLMTIKCKINQKQMWIGLILAEGKVAEEWRHLKNEQELKNVICQIT